MKSYPSIPRDFSEFEAYVFDKLDGSNLRFEWSRKGGWNKFGTRNRLFDETDDIFGPALPLFYQTLAKELHDIFKSERYERAVVFCEYWGENSFAGLHEPGDVKNLTLFDVAPHKQGILGPKEFLKLYGHLNVPRFIGRLNWTRGFVERVWNGDVEGVTFEGVIGKSKHSHHDLIMCKAKTKAWIDKVKSRYSAVEAQMLINS
jgi:hypothetical protein